MQTTQMLCENLFKHSVLILWRDDRQKWVAECPILNIKLESEDYKNLFADFIRQVLLQDDHAFEFADKHKSVLEK